MKPPPTDERRMLIEDILRTLGPNTSALSKDLTKAELQEQPTEILRAMRATLQPKRHDRTYFGDRKT